jgi:hypothetical protein
MKLKIKDLFIGLEFKIEREVDIPKELLFDRIARELETLDYEVVEGPAEKILFKERSNDQLVSTYYFWDRVDSGSFEIIEANKRQSLRFMFSVSISGPILAISAIVGMFFAIDYMIFPFALIFGVLNTQKSIDTRNKMHEIFNNVTRQEIN